MVVLVVAMAVVVLVGAGAMSARLPLGAVVFAVKTEKGVVEVMVSRYRTPQSQSGSVRERGLRARASPMQPQQVLEGTTGNESQTHGHETCAEHPSLGERVTWGLEPAHPRPNEPIWENLDS